MEQPTKVSSLEVTFFSVLLVWLIITTQQVAPLNPPQWAGGAWYFLWWALVLWGLLIASMTPSGFVVIVSAKVLGSKKGVLIFGFCSLWMFDWSMRKHYPTLPVTPGYALSLLYVFVTISKKWKLSE